MTPPEINLAGKICIVTGSTSGIGKVTALELARLNATTVLVGRDRIKCEQVKQEIIAQTNNQNVDFLLCDLSSQTSIRNLVNEFNHKYSNLHILVNNAGIWETQRKETIDHIESMFATNHLAPFLLTNLLLEVLKNSAPARIVNVSSGLHTQGKINFDDIEGKNKFDFRKAYNQSKLANILFNHELAKRLKDTQVTANSLSPGVVATNLSRNLNPVLKFFTKLFFSTPEQGAQTSIYLASSPEVQNISGKYFVTNKIKNSSSESTNDDIALKLWELSESYVQLK